MRGHIGFKIPRQPYEASFLRITKITPAILVTNFTTNEPPAWFLQQKPENDAAAEIAKEQSTPQNPTTKTE